MVRFLLLVIFSLSLPLQVNAADKVVASQSKVVTVHGMVCAFCSNNLEKKFKEKSEVKDIAVDLKSQKVSIHFKPGLSIENKTIETMITASGFKVVSIKNLEAPLDKK